jgi:Protein of unknown function (DUF1648)
VVQEDGRTSRNVRQLFEVYFSEERMKTVREAIALVGLVFTVALVAEFYTRLPERLATHFNAAGEANGFGGRSSLWVLVGVAALLYGLLTAINFLPPVMISLRALGPERRRVIWTSVLSMVGWVKAEMVLVFAYLCVAIVRSGMGIELGAERAFLPVMMAVTGVTCGFYLAKIFGLLQRSDAV